MPTYADALEEMATRSLSCITSTSRSAHYRVSLHLDTSGAWANGGHAIPLRLLTRFISDGVAQPVWETEGRPASVGRKMRILPARTRRVDRDRGTTDETNQVSLCTTHHDGITRGDYTLTGDPTGPDGLTATTRTGLPIRPPTPTETGPPPGSDPPIPDDTYQPPIGEPLHWHDLALPTDHELRHGTDPAGTFTATRTPRRTTTRRTPGVPVQ